MRPGAPAATAMAPRKDRRVRPARPSQQSAMYGKGRPWLIALEGGYLPGLPLTRSSRFYPPEALMSLSAISRRSTFLTMVLAGSLSAQAMPPPGGPPPYLQIVREEVKVGRGGAPHLQAEVGWPRDFGKAKIANNYLALTTLYGPNEAWFVEGHNSIAEIEAVNKAIADAPGLSQELDRLTQADAANITNVRTLLGRFQASMSNPGSVSPPEMRAWEIIIFRVRPGHEGDFVQATNLYRRPGEEGKGGAPGAALPGEARLPGPRLPHPRAPQDAGRDRSS